MEVPGEATYLSKQKFQREDDFPLPVTGTHSLPVYDKLPRIAGIGPTSSFSLKSLRKLTQRVTCNSHDINTADKMP